jgi:hypothetical protein
MIQETVTPEQFRKLKAALALDKINAKKKAIRWFIDNLLIEHFQIGNTQRYGYTPNSAKYEAWKKKFGGNIQLVLSGKLKEAVIRSARTTNEAKIKVSVPEYGIINIQLGRDFLKPNSQELKIISKKYKEFLVQIRKKTVATILNKR